MMSYVAEMNYEFTIKYVANSQRLSLELSHFYPEFSVYFLYFSSVFAAMLFFTCKLLLSVRYPAGVQFLIVHATVELVLRCGAGAGGRLQVTDAPVLAPPAFCLSRVRGVSDGFSHFSFCECSPSSPLRIKLTSCPFTEYQRDLRAHGRAAASWSDLKKKKQDSSLQTWTTVTFLLDFRRHLFFWELTDSISSSTECFSYPAECTSWPPFLFITSAVFYDDKPKQQKCSGSCVKREVPGARSFVAFLHSWQSGSFSNPLSILPSL